MFHVCRCFHVSRLLLFSCFTFAVVFMFTFVLSSLYSLGANASVFFELYPLAVCASGNQKLVLLN